MVSEYNKIKSIIHHAIGMVLAFIMLYPLIWMLMSSFKANEEIFITSYSLWPETWDIVENYKNGWSGLSGINFGTFIVNSLIVTFFATLGNLVSSLMAAFSLARVKFIGAKFWFTCVMITMLVPSQVMVVPQYIIFKKLGLINTRLSIISPWFFGGAFFIFMMIQFIRGLPRELDEAAAIDGCSQLNIITKILLPNITPAIVTSAIFSIYWCWQDFFQPLIFIDDPKKYTIPLALKSYLDPTSYSDYGAMLAMSVVSILPVIIFFLVFQKHLVEGVATSGLKG
ncbi:MAG: carbohydrate ABC transporter permease [Lachnospirales bacterium]